VPQCPIADDATGGGRWGLKAEPTVGSMDRARPRPPPAVIGLGVEAPEAEYISMPDSQFRLQFAHERPQYAKKSVGLQHLQMPESATAR